MDFGKRKVVPSILAADFTVIGKDVETVKRAGAEWIHLDVMDGHFVPPISFGARMVGAIRNITDLVLDVHLMTEEPERLVGDFAEAGADRLTFHIETVTHSHRLLNDIRSLGIKTGIALVPSTPVQAIGELLGDVDQVLVMSVNPGWSGQDLIPGTLEKVARLDSMRRKGAGDFTIVIDGGFNRETASRVWLSGVDVAVMGSAFFECDDPVALVREVCAV